MKNIANHVYNKCKQYAHRIFYTSMNNTVFLNYTTLFSTLLTLDTYVRSRVRNKEAYITLVSSNVLLKTLVSIYCLFTSTKLLMISPKFDISEIINTILSKRGVNILLIDKEILSKIEKVEVEEGINILEFFESIMTTMKFLEVLLEDKFVSASEKNVESKIYSLNKLLNKVSNEAEPKVSIFSPGTMSDSYITNVLYKTLGKSMLSLSYFMGFKAGDKVSVIADFEFYPGIYTILGLMSGVHYIMPEKDMELSSGEELRDLLSKSDCKPNILIISSNNFRKVWDSVLLKVYSNRFVFFLSKHTLTDWIVDKIILKEIRKVFGKQMERVHILNEELGFAVLDTLKHSKIMFSSSYGFLEQGNFLAFKNPQQFKHKNFIYKSGGTILKDSEEGFNKVYAGEKGKVEEIIIEESTILSPNAIEVTELKSGDYGTFIPNVKDQGDRRYLHVNGKILRNNAPLLKHPHLDMIEKSIKDGLIIRDCFLKRILMSDEKGCNVRYYLYIEPRKDLLDMRHIGWKELDETIQEIIKDLEKELMLDIENYGILEFNGLRNVAGKLQFYTLQQ